MRAVLKVTLSVTDTFKQTIVYILEICQQDKICVNKIYYEKCIDYSFLTVRFRMTLSDSSNHVLTSNYYDRLIVYDSRVTIFST